LDRWERLADTAHEQWAVGLKFGNGGNGGLVNSLYITAGLNDEQDGLFAQITAAPEPGTWLLVGRRTRRVGCDQKTKRIKGA